MENFEFTFFLIYYISYISTILNKLHKEFKLVPSLRNYVKYVTKLLMFFILKVFNLLLSKQFFTKQY